MTDDRPDWVYLDDHLAARDMTLAEFRERHPFVNLDHTGDGGRTIVDLSELND